MQQNLLYLDFLLLDFRTFHGLVFRTEYDVSEARFISFFVWNITKSSTQTRNLQRPFATECSFRIATCFSVRHYKSYILRSERLE
jgi:hypothetical protein